MIQDVARRIARERIAPVAADFDKSGEFPAETIKVLGENGLMGIEVPHEYGGAGLDPVALRARDDRDRRGGLRALDHHERQQHALLQRPAEVRHARAEAALRDADRVGRGDRRVRADRAAVGLGRVAPCARAR